MAEGATNFNVQYSGAIAKSLVDEINAELEAAETAHTKAINAWRTVKGKFTLSAASMANLNKVDDESEGLDTTEFKKVVDSLRNLIAGVGNINSTWQDVSTKIDEAISTYIGNKQ